MNTFRSKVAESKHNNCWYSDEKCSRSFPRSFVGGQIWIIDTSQVWNGALMQPGTGVVCFMCDRVRGRCGQQDEGVLWLKGRRRWGLLEQPALVWCIRWWYFLSTTCSPQRVTDVRAMALSTVMGFYQEGALRHCVRVCVYVHARVKHHTPTSSLPYFIHLLSYPDSICICIDCGLTCVSQNLHRAHSGCLCALHALVD